MKKPILGVSICALIILACLPGQTTFFGQLPSAVANDRPMRDTEIKRGKRITKQATNQRLLLTGPADLVIKEAENPLVNSEVHLNHEQASVTFESLRPSQVIAQLSDEIMVNGRPARDGSNASLKAVVNGTIVTPTSRSTAPLQIFHERSYKGKTYSYQAHTHYNLLQLRQGNDKPASFILQPGYMCTLTEHTGAEGYTQTFVARAEELRVAGMPGGLRGKVSTIHIKPWRRTGKKGVHASLEQAQKLGTHWYTTGIAERASNKQTLGESTLDIEYVPVVRSNRAEINALNKRKGMTHMLLNDKPEVPGPPPTEPAEVGAEGQAPAETDAQTSQEPAPKLDPEEIEHALDRWAPRPVAGLRLGSPTLTEANANWVYAFVAGARRRGVQIDFIPVQVDRPDWTVQQLVDWLEQINQRTDKPIWLTRFNHAAPVAEGSAPSPEQHAEHLIAICDALDKARFVERYAVSVGEGPSALIDAAGNLTPVGQAYHDHASVEAYTEKQ